MSLGAPEILMILVLALLVFGPKKLPEVSRQVGEAMRELRKVQHTVKGEIDRAMKEPTPTLPPRDPDARHLRAIEPDDHETAPSGLSDPSTPSAAPPVEPGDSFL
jgi:sec-independent protein translocase protein TatA